MPTQLLTIVHELISSFSLNYFPVFPTRRSFLSLLYTTYKYQLYILMNRSHGGAIKNFYRESIINFFTICLCIRSSGNYFEILLRICIYLYFFYKGINIEAKNTSLLKPFNADCTRLRGRYRSQNRINCGHHHFDWYEDLGRQCTMSPLPWHCVNDPLSYRLYASTPTILNPWICSKKIKKASFRKD